MLHEDCYITYSLLTTSKKRCSSRIYSASTREIPPVACRIVVCSTPALGWFSSLLMEAAIWFSALGMEKKMVATVGLGI